MTMTMIMMSELVQAAAVAAATAESTKFMTRRKSAQNTRNCTAQWERERERETEEEEEGNRLCGGPNHFGGAMASRRPTKVDNMWIFLVTFEFI